MTRAMQGSSFVRAMCGHMSMKWLISSMAPVLAVAWALAGCVPPPDASLATCGDGVLDEIRGEQCDDAGESVTCNRNCTLLECGDGYVNTVARESCDDGNQEPGDGCSASCQSERCGDGVRDRGEHCDDGNRVSGDGCSAMCESEQCGNRIVDVDEVCDDGGESERCDRDCTPAACRDGVRNATAGEACDNGGESAACDWDCTPVECGDGRQNLPAGEGCDDGNALAGDGCSATCQIERCGNGILDGGEQCDDGNSLAGDGCSASCLSEVCGNGVVDPGERCDDGAETAWCNADCTPVLCGDGVVNSAAGEACDEAGAMTATCDADCTAPAWGDGVVNAAFGEQCDDGGESVTCDNDCTMAWCGDGTVNASRGEVCDAAGDSFACDRDCTAILCGDGHVNRVVGEQCDDGGQVSGDGCSAACQLERCGNGRLDPGEACDDGGQVSGDGCSTDCRSEEVCGNGIVDAALGEQCDDEGPSAACDADCTISWCGDGMVNALAGEACDASGVETAACDRDCTVPLCGDGQVNLAAGEECEGGGETMFCDADCTFAWCGDGTPNTTRGEACDDANANDGDWCRTTCEAASCDDGIRNGDEQGVDCGGHCAECVAIDIVAGGYHSCALLETGTVRCWGRNSEGQLGYGNTSNIGDDEAPATAGDVDVGGVVVQLVGGDLHTCALLETGAVRCWGYSNAGQLGYGSTSSIGDNEVPATAGDVDVGGGVVQLAAGVFHTCALLETGTVRCWGYGMFGQLGYGNMSNIGDNEVPATAGDVDVGGVVVQLAAGGYHTCALLETGGVRCWGDGRNGRLGYGNTSWIGDNETPAMVGDVDVGGVVVQLAAGGAHTCVLLETGSVRCWGHGLYGQLGYGNNSSIGDAPGETPATAGDVDVGGVVVQLAAGGEHTCALLETGAVRCWGRGLYGRLGYGNEIWIGNDETPATAGNVDVGGGVVQLAAGWTHTCALLETGAVRCWGFGLLGRLGYGNEDNIGDDGTPASAGDVPYR
jgi:cysteine-rich repeat protein